MRYAFVTYIGISGRRLKKDFFQRNQRIIFSGYALSSTIKESNLLNLKRF